MLAEVGRPAGSWEPGAIPKALLHKVWSPDQQQRGSLFGNAESQSPTQTLEAESDFSKTLRGVICMLKSARHSQKARHSGPPPEAVT